MARSISKPTVPSAAGVHQYHRRLLVDGLPDPPSPSTDNSKLGAADAPWAAAAGAFVLLVVALMAFALYREMRRFGAEEEQETNGGGGGGRGTRTRSSSSNSNNGRGDGGGGRARLQQEQQRQPPAAAVECTYRSADGWEEGTCTVCISELVDGEAVMLLTRCMHCFHAACVDTWLRDNGTCPICRATATAVAAADKTAKDGRPELNHDPPPPDLNVLVTR